MGLEKQNKNIFSDKLDYCKMYLHFGFTLVPLAPKSKAPYTPVLGKYDGKISKIKLNPPDLEEIKSWLDKEPEINLAVMLGEPSNLIVVDVDEPKYVELDEKIKAKTPRISTVDGYHLPFRKKEDVENKNMNIKGIHVGEVRGDGLYSVVPPSIHPDGKRYRWNTDFYGLDNYFDNLDDKNTLYYKDVNIKKIKDKTRETDLTRININLVKSCPSSSNIINNKHVIDNKDNKDVVNNINIRKDNEPDVKDVRINDGGEEGSTPGWKELTREEEVAKDIMKEAGVNNVELDKSFCCPFHEENNPSASLWKLEGGYIAYHDFHKQGEKEWYNLGEVYKAIHTGHLESLKSGEALAWWLRGLYETGYLGELPTIQSKKLSIVENICHFQKNEKKVGVKAENVREVYEGFKYLLQLRTYYDDSQVGTPFSWRFAADWCGVSRPTLKKAMTYLLKNDYIEVVEEFSSQYKPNIMDVKRK